MTTTIYGSNVPDTILTTACKMATSSGGTETSVTTTIPSTSQPYAEIRSRGGSSTAVASLPAPTGNGWVWWCGAGSIPAGNWSAIATNSSVSRGVNTVIRFYKISSSFVYTAIGSITVNQTSTSKTTYTYAATAMPSVTTVSGDGIYVDRWFFDNNANVGGDNPTNFVSSSATAGVANDMQVTMPTFTPGGTTSSRTVPASIALQSSQLARTVPATIALQSSQNPRTVPASMALQSTGLQRVVPATLSLANTFSRTVPATIALSQPVSRTVPATIALQSLQNARTVPATFALIHTLDRTVPASIALASTSSRTIPATIALTQELTSGGITLFASGTGTASFTNFRATQYPDPALSLAPVLDRLGTSNVAWNATTPTNTTLTIKTSTDGIHWSDATSGSTISGLTGQPDPVIDVFKLNSLENYTNTCKNGGNVATPTYDTTNSRLTLAGGSGAVYLNSSISASDIDVICDMDESDAGGLVWRFVDSSNYYELAAHDDSSTSGFTNQLRLYKVSSGTRSLLGSASSIMWYRSTPDTSPYKRIRVTMLGSVITVYFDGVQMQTYTDDAPLDAGKCGLRNDGGTSRYYQLRIQEQGDDVSGTPAGDIVTGGFVYTQATLSTTDPSVTPQLLDLTTSARSPNIATGTLISQLHDPSKPFAEFYNNEMTSLAQDSGDFYWSVDQNGKFTFKDRSATPAPFCIHSTDLLFAPQVTPTNAADLYRNRQIITNTVGLVTVTGEEKVADGVATSWSVKYPLYSAPTITVNKVAKTVGIQGQDTGKDFYWQSGSASIAQDASADVIPSGYVLSFDYTGQFPDQVVRDNLEGQAERRAVEGGSGIVTAILDGKQMLSSAAITKADGLLARHNNNDTVSVQMTTEVRLGLQAGQVVPCFLPEHHINNRQLLVTKVTRTGYMGPDGVTVYRDTITATDGPNLSNWADAILS